MTHIERQAKLIFFTAVIAVRGVRICNIVMINYLGNTISNKFKTDPRTFDV